MGVRHPSQAALNVRELLSLVSNDTELLQELITLFKKELPIQMSALRRAVGQNDWKTTEKASHTLKGMSLSLAASRVATAAAQLGESSRTGQTLAVSGALAVLENEIELLMPELEACLVKMAL